MVRIYHWSTHLPSRSFGSASGGVFCTHFQGAKGGQKAGVLAISFLLVFLVTRQRSAVYTPKLYRLTVMALRFLRIAL